MKKRHKKNYFFKKNYFLSWEHVKESKNYILFTILIFLSGAVLSLFYQPQSIVEAIKKILENLLKETADLNAWQMVIFILKNNLGVSFISMLLGVFFGIFPVFTALANGYVLGFVAEKSVEVEGISILWLLFPHGIFELPAVFLSLALGARLGMFFLAKNKKKEFLKRLVESLRVFLFIILPLLIIAAVIEGVLIKALG